MNLTKKLTALALAALTVMALTACGGGSTKSTVYAVEAGSAGEEVAKANGFEIISVESQAKALMEVDAGTADAAIIDLLMAGAMVGEGTSYPDIKITDQKLNSEQYGVGCRKGSDLAAFLNAVLSDAWTDGTMMALAKTYGVQEAILEQPAAAYPEADPAGDVAYIQGKGTLVVGITDWAPMDYEEVTGSGEWVGFDADMARLLAKKLGVDVQFVVIDWSRKVDELEGKSVDVVWNGMTLTEGVLAAMECSNPYCSNAQVVVTK